MALMRKIKASPKLWNLWPPFLFAGIKIVEVAKDYRRIVTKLILRSWNTNYVGTQYGGSIYSMADPFYMIMLIKNLSSDYEVWDKSATIRYLRPGRTDLLAEFTLSQEEIDSILSTLQTQSRMLWNKKIFMKIFLFQSIRLCV